MKKMLPAVFVVLLWGASVQAQTTLTGTWQGRRAASISCWS